MPWLMADDAEIAIGFSLFSECTYRRRDLAALSIDERQQRVAG